MISRIIEHINGGFKGIIQGEQYYGLAQTVMRIQGTEREGLPGIVGSNGEVRYVGFDDVHPIIVYHKLNNVATARVANGKGDKLGDMQYIYQLAMYVYWDRKKIGLQPDELMMLLQGRYPNAIQSEMDIKSITMRLTGMNANTSQLITQEYQGSAFIPAPEKSFMQINYSVDIIFNPACLPVCL